MVVRVRITAFPRVRRGNSGQGISGEFAPALAGLLTLVSVVCFVMSAWKLFSEFGWAGNFFISAGIFSHWQIWIAGAVAAQLISFRLSRSRPRPLIS
jgi:hypothetical protein